MVLTGHSHRKLIHDAALHADKIVLCSLRHFDQIEQGKRCAEKLIDCESRDDFDRCGRAQTGTIGHIPGIQTIDTIELNVSFDKLIKHAKRVIYPVVAIGLIDFCLWQLGHQIEVGRCETIGFVIGTSDQ